VSNTYLKEIELEELRLSLVTDNPDSDCSHCDGFLDQVKANLIIDTDENREYLCNKCLFDFLKGELEC